MRITYLLLISILLYSINVNAQPASAVIDELVELVEADQADDAAPLNSAIAPSIRNINSTEKLTNQANIDGYLLQLNALSQQKFTLGDDNAINEIIEQQQQKIQALIGLLRHANQARLTSLMDKKRLSFLNSRININQDRGNLIAVNRDQFELEYIRTREQTKLYLQYLISASRSYKSTDEVVTHSEEMLTLLNQRIKGLSLILPAVDNNIYRELENNYYEYQYVNAVYKDILDYVITNPNEITSIFWFHRFSLLSVINWINEFDLIKPLNYKLAPFNIDGGGIFVALFVVFLIIFCYPLFLRFSSWFIDRIILYQAGDHSSLIIRELRRPLKLLMLFFSIDMATYALLYKTAYKVSLENFVFIVYASLAVWIVAKLLDTFFIIQVEKIARTNKDLRKELVNLGIYFAKGGVFLVALSLVLNRYGISITAIVSTLGIGGLAFALAAKDTLSNLFGGMTILIDNVFRMGDWVTIGKDEGTVAEIGLRSTTIRTFDNALITIPNSMVSVSSVKNWNRRTVGRRIKLYVGVTYESNMDDLRQCVTDIRTMLHDHPDISNPKEKYGSRRLRLKLSSREDTLGIKSTQLVFIDRFGDFSIDIMIYCFSKTVSWAEWLGVKEDILLKIAEILEKNNLQFAYPTELVINRSEITAHDLPEQ